MKLIAYIRHKQKQFSEQGIIGYVYGTLFLIFILSVALLPFLIAWFAFDLFTSFID